MGLPPGSRFHPRDRRVMGGLDPDSPWVIRNVLAAATAFSLVALGGFKGTRNVEGSIDRHIETAPAPLRP